MLRDKHADILHMHGYGATTFGRLCAWRMGIPAILHEHANHGDTPWFQKVADRMLAPHTDLAIAVSESTGEFTTRARLMPAERTKVVYLGAPLDEFARPRTADEIAAARAAMGIAPGTIAIGTVTRLMPAKGNQYLIDAAPRVLAAHPDARFFIVGEGELQPELEAQARALSLGDRLVFTGFTRDVAAALSALDLARIPVAGEGTPLTVFEALAMGKPIVATDADGLVDVLTDRQDALVVPKANAEALARAITTLLESTGAGRRAGRGGAERPARATTLPPSSERWSGCTSCCMRHGSAAFARRFGGPGREGILKTDLSFLTTEARKRMTTIDTSVAARLQGRSLAWRLGASTTAAIGVLLLTWALSLDFVKASGGGFFGDAATYYTLGHSLATDFDFEYQRDDLVRVWEEFPTGPEGLFLKRGRDSQLFFAKAYIYPLLAAPFIWLFGTNGFLVLARAADDARASCARTRSWPRAVIRSAR